MSLVTGAMIFLVSGQMLVGRTHPWLPRYLQDIELPRDRVVEVGKRAKPWVDKLSLLLSSRWPRLLQSPVPRLVAICCMGLAMLFYPLALVPFAVAVPGLAVLFFSLGMVAQDGVMIAAGFLVTLIAAGMVVSLWPF